MKHTLFLISITFSHLVFAQVGNGSFENWCIDISRKPVDWSSAQDIDLGHAGLGLINMTNDSYKGEFALELNTKRIGDEVVVGWLTNGNATVNGGFSGGRDLRVQPELFRGAYKFEPAGNDTAWIAMEFKMNDKSIAFRVIQFYNQQEEYKPINYPLDLTETCDQVTFLLYPGDQPGSKFTLDDLSLGKRDFSISESDFNEDLLRSNDGDSYARIRYDMTRYGGATITVFNSTGRPILITKLYDKSEGTHAAYIETTKFDKGLYTCQITMEESVQINKFTVF